MIVTTEQKRVVNISREKYEGWVGLMSGMTRPVKVEEWRSAVGDAERRLVCANEMLMFWNEYMESVKSRSRWSGWTDVPSSTAPEVICNWYVAMKVGFRSVTAEMDDFIEFAGPQLERGVEYRPFMVRLLERYYEEKLLSAVAKILSVCDRRNGGICDPSVSVRFVYFLQSVDTDDVDVESARSISRSYTRFVRYENQFDGARMFVWREMVHGDIEALSAHVRDVMEEMRD